MDQQNIVSNESELNEMQKKLMEELGLSELPKDKQQDLIIKMTEAVLKRIFVETIDRLSEEDNKIYQEMIEKNSSPEEIDQFLKSKIENYEEMTRKAIDEFKEEMKKQLPE